MVAGYSAVTRQIQLTFNEKFADTSSYRQNRSNLPYSNLFRFATFDIGSESP